jgi:hypothetical protein
MFTLIFMGPPGTEKRNILVDNVACKFFAKVISSEVIINFHLKGGAF